MILIGKAHSGLVEVSGDVYPEATAAEVAYHRHKSQGALICLLCHALEHPGVSEGDAFGHVAKHGSVTLKIATARHAFHYLLDGETILICQSVSCAV